MLVLSDVTTSTVLKILHGETFEIHCTKAYVYCIKKIIKYICKEHDICKADDIMQKETPYLLHI